MRIEHFVVVIAAAFTLENAMAAPSDAAKEPTGRTGVQAIERLDSVEPPARDEEPESDAPGAEELRFCSLDGCEVEHQGCVCSNTGWNGYCGWGPHHPGCLYCRCD